MKTLDDYLASLTPVQMKHYKRIRDIVHQVAPDAEETLSYAIPTFKYKGKYLIYFAAYEKHMSVYGGTALVEKDLEGFKTSGKGTIQFTDEKPVPEDIVKQIVANRRIDIDR